MPAPGYIALDGAYIAPYGEQGEQGAAGWHAPPPYPPPQNGKQQQPVEALNTARHAESRAKRFMGDVPLRGRRQESCSAGCPPTARLNSQPVCGRTGTGIPRKRIARWARTKGGSSRREVEGEVTIVLPAANDRKRGGTIERGQNSVKTIS
jgi:hypothetical protein